MKLILASSSPRRAEVLRDAGIAFEVRAVDVDETTHAGESAESLVARLAGAKCRAASESFGDEKDCIVIGADTVVEMDGKIFGKPRNARHARAMLTALSGRTHRVLSGVFLMRLPDGVNRSAVEITSVTFAALDQVEIDAYVATCEPMDKAGAYAIQGRAGRFIPKIRGCYFNVVGLPLARVYALLRDLGWREEAE